ncbi:MAG: hypothetical protein B7X02_00115 [Rhodospirillales bacterium 12-54-5]|nr:MAG: hypothetical protein B7X02_00115 [Rhodospirillales bacterium 12-54-5]
MPLTSMIEPRRILEILRELTQLALNVVYPPECPSCRAPVDTMHNLCSDCFARVRMIAKPLCACCGVPFVVPMEGENQCPQCLDVPPAFTRARSVMVYDAVSAPLITALKFHDQWAGLRRYDMMLQHAGAELLETADILAPIPLHWRRLWQRKYNQSALLAYGVAKRVNVPCIPHLMVRTRRTKPQMKLKRAERLKNVRNAFAVTPKCVEQVRDKHIVLIDDVMTTGATADVCAQALRKAGAREVSVLTLARTVRE